jgi:hypothetical protein
LVDVCSVRWSRLTADVLGTAFDAKQLGGLSRAMRKAISS